MPNGISFDSLGRIIIEDAELGQQIINWMQLGREVSLRVPFPSGLPPVSTSTSTVLGTDVTLGPKPVPAPIPMLNSCPNSMCDCPVFKIKLPGDGILESDTEMMS